MKYSLFEISEIYQSTFKYVQKKYKEYTEQTGKKKRVKKRKEIFLKNDNLKNFLKFCGFEVEAVLKNDRKKVTANQSESVQSLLKEKDKQITFLRRQLKKVEKDRDKLIDLYEKEILKKDTLLKESITQINIYKNLNKNIVKNIEYLTNTATEILDRDKKNICIIEDDPDQIHILKTNLQKENFQVYDFNNVTDPTPVLEQFGLIILDLNIEKTDPLKNAEKWIEILKKYEIPVPPVIIISGESEERIKNAVKQTNAVDYFKKPFNIKEMVKRVKEIV